MSDLCELLKRAVEDEEGAQEQYSTMIRSLNTSQRIAAEIIQVIREQETAHKRILEALQDLYCRENEVK